MEQFVNTIQNMDCLEFAKQLPDNCIDCIVTDPPYGIKAHSGFAGFEGFRGKGEKIERRSYIGNWDNKTPDKECFDEILRISKNAIIFGGNYFTDKLPVSNHWLVWDKLQTMPTFSDCELIYTNIKRNSVKKYTVEWNGLLGKESKRFHPTQKPEVLIKKILLDYTKQNDIIFDGFMGSGTTAIACLETKRRYIGCELDKGYFDIAQKRIDDYNKQLKLF